MKIAIYNRGIPFDGDSPFKQPLGGSETSIVHIARELSKLGHEATVYTNVPPGNRDSSLTEHAEFARTFSGVPYRRCTEFFTDYGSALWDVLISFRSFEPFLLGRIAPRMIFWTGDAYDQPALKDFEHASLQQNIDLIFCVSEWHRKSFIQAFGLPPEKVIATRNG